MLRVVDRIIHKINHKFEFIDLGGGMGISYKYEDKKLNYSKYSEIIKKFLSYFLVLIMKKINHIFCANSIKSSFQKKIKAFNILF